jgi:hypothetical protein
MSVEKIVADMKARREKTQKENLARVVRRFAKLPEEKRRALIQAYSYRKPPKRFGICEVCGETFAA